VTTADGYIRVSRVGGRGGESFISPDEQRAAIEAWAKATKTTIVEWHQDLDQSGGTLDRPAFTMALERCRAGLTGGIVAAKLDRLTRSVVGLASLLDDAAEHGYNIVALDLGLDLRSPNGELVANVLGSVAQWERKRRADDWDTARRNAVSRGIPNGRAPYGYRKRSDGRLEVVNREARIVRDAFRQRADGVPFAVIGRQHGWSHSTCRQIVMNEAYLGVARSGAYSNENAHPAIVTRQEWDAAHAARTTQPVPDGATTSGRLLKGIARCAGCGRTLKVVSRRRADDTLVPAYFCKNAASTLCPERAFVRADALDGYIETWFAKALRSTPRMVDVVAAARELEDAQAEQASAESELYAFVESASALDPALFQRGVDARHGRVDEARERVRELSGRVRQIPAGGRLSDVWNTFSRDERRSVVAGFVGAVHVRRGASEDLARCVRVEWSDGTVALDVADDEQRVRVAAA
jgi:DNA invertase Pin-like site-specific DNA recombinase